MLERKSSLVYWVILFILGGIWGSSFILLKIGSRHFNTFEIASLRMFFAGALMIPCLVSILKKHDRNTLFWMLVSALLGSGIPAFFYAYSSSKMDSNINGVINSLTPIFTLVVGMLWLKQKMSRWSILGVWIGFLGVLLLLSQNHQGESQIQYAVYPLLASMMYGVNMNIVKTKLSHLPSVDILKGVFGLLGILFFPYILYSGALKHLDFSSFSLHFWETSSTLEIQAMRSLTALFIVGFIGSLFASYIFYYLVKRTSALFASTNTYIIPMMSIFWGYLDHEFIGVFHFISLGIILLGVYLVSKYK